MPLTIYEDGSALRAYSSTIKGQVFSSNRIFQEHPAGKAFDTKAAAKAAAAGGMRDSMQVDSVVHTPL